MLSETTLNTLKNSSNLKLPKNFKTIAGSLKPFELFTQKYSLSKSSNK